ncbi:SIMPL domain-containing protein [Ruegeria sp. WL0004]|uniref:SIMPL domain-containing protein n=1 Tax=Ruegeria marisflavi TaxID=2984152 RepID=A0ABT2WW09_9RHOB|nr:SIMPL domain-containing protein [Ruegeria sp. WL0004]MCU9839215.1 SIMPL domain-containing protein [Ruegeria sp. WL0004]
MRTLVFLVVALLLAAVGLARADEQPGQITVTGTGVVETVPDMAVITLGVTQEAKEARAALSATSEAVGRALDRLTELGIEARDMQTSDLSLSPVWSNRGSSTEPPAITGFQASNRVTVRVRDLARLGEILDTVVSDGANTFNGLEFSVKEPKPLRDQARAKAVADARDKAQQLAEAAGVSLGRIVSISELYSDPQPRPMMRMAAIAESMDVPVAGGEIGLSGTVTMVYEIRQ